MKTLVLLTLTISSLAFAGDGGSSSTGPAHPASRLCDDLNGQKLEVTSDLGQDELCFLDHAAISSMTLWIALNGSPELATLAYLNPVSVPVPVTGNPASDYCETVGGTVKMAKSDSGAEYGICTFNENGHLSGIEEWTLFRGLNDPGNQILTRLLQSCR